MASNTEKEFLSKVQKEIQQRIKSESKTLDELKIEEDELEQAIIGYGEFFDELCKFIKESCKDFECEEEDIADYFKSNINEVYQNYVQIRKDALEEIQILNKYLEKNKKDLSSTQRTLKFYRSQYMDSDFFEECLPLVSLYQEKIDIYNKNEKNTHIIIKKLEEIENKLRNWK